MSWLSMKNVHDIACKTWEWWFTASAGAYSQQRHIRESFNWLACSIYNRAKFYADLTVYLLSDFPFLRTSSIQTRDLSENELCILTAEKISMHSQMSFKRFFGFPLQRSIQLNSEYGRDSPPWNKLFGNRSLNRFYSIFSPPLYRSLRRNVE